MARILIVDDDPMVLDLVHELLSIQGHTMDKASDGAQAVAKLGQATYDLLIIDRNMPIMNGVEAIAAVRRDARHQTLKILMFTSASDPATRAEALKAGANGFLNKPIQLQEFSATIQQALTA
jgi:DNA-binding response OmpR family regulator